MGNNNDNDDEDLETGLLGRGRSLSEVNAFDCTSFASVSKTKTLAFKAPKPAESVGEQVNSLQQGLRKRTQSGGGGSDEAGSYSNLSAVIDGMDHALNVARLSKREESFHSIRSFDNRSDDDDDGAADNGADKESHQSKQSASLLGSQHQSASASSTLPRPKTEKSTWRRMQTLNNIILPSSFRANSSATISPRTMDTTHKASSMSALMMADMTQPVQNKGVLDKLQKAKEELEARQLQSKQDANNNATLLLTSKQAMQSLMKNAYFFCFTAW